MYTSTIFGLDYPTIWFLVVGALFTGYAILDGFDFGAGAWHLTFKKEISRRTALNAIGPVWDGNEVWLVIGGGALFAGFPVVYATLFSAMYTPFILFLIFLIFRAVSIEFRSKEPMLWWRKLWDITYSVSSIVLSILLGVVVGNVLQGMPLDQNQVYNGSSFWGFLKPFPILVGISTLALFMTHGAIYLLLKTEGRLYARISVSLRRSIVFFLLSFALTSAYALVFLPHLTQVFKDQPLWFLVPLFAILSMANLPRLAIKHKYREAFAFSSISIALLFMIVAINLYPNLLISSMDPKYHIDIYRAAASEKSLGIMILMAAMGTPLVLSYTLIIYYTFRGKVKIDESSY